MAVLKNIFLCLLVFNSSLFASKLSKNLRIFPLITHAPLSNNTLNKLAGCCNIPYEKIKPHMELIIQAIHHFHGSPGFHTTLALLIKQCDNNQYNGAVFELEKALDIKKKLPHATILFGQHRKMPHHKINREFDLIAQYDDKEFWIECKNINWENCKQEKQFEEQQKITKHYHTAEKNIHYLVCSRRAITATWQQWFDLQGINYEEFNPDDN